MEIIIPSVKINKKIYIPMIDTIMTRENIDSLPIFEEEKKHSKSYNEGRKNMNKLLT